MDLNNPIETKVHCLLIRGMICLGHQDGFLMVSALVFMFIHWTRPTINYEVRLSVVMIHQATMLHGLTTLRGY